MREPSVPQSRGNPRSVTGTNPAAGVEVTEAVPGNALWRLKSIRVSLAVGVAAITPVLNIRDDADAVVASFPIGTATASATEILTWTEGGGEVFDDAAGTITCFLTMDCYLFQAWDMTTSGVSADDDYAAPQLWVEEWMEE